MNAVLAHFNDFKAKQATRALTASALQAINPHLVPISDKVGSLVAAAKNMRIELKAAFPSIKFSVKSKSYSMGNSINVSWTDGPTDDQIESIIDKSAAGHFDGSDDSYKDERSTWKDAFGSAMYVHANRHDSDMAIASAIRTVCNKYDLFPAPTVAEYNSGSLNNVTHKHCGDTTLQCLVRRTIQNRTWTLTKATQ